MESRLPLPFACCSIYFILFHFIQFSFYLFKCLPHTPPFESLSPLFPKRPGTFSNFTIGSSRNKGVFSTRVGASKNASGNFLSSMEIIPYLVALTWQFLGQGLLRSSGILMSCRSATSDDKLKWDTSQILILELRWHEKILFIPSTR